MDTIQLLLIVILTITTILMIVVGTQLISTLKEIRRSLKKNNHDQPKPNKHIIVKKNNTAIHSIINRMKILSPATHEKHKRFFVKQRS